MKGTTLLAPLVLSALLVMAACATAAPAPTPTPPAGPGPIELEYDFREGALGWEVGFADYAPDMDMQLEAGIRPLPAGLGVDGTGFYLQGMNRSDDLFMFLKRRLGPEDGVEAGTTYRVTYTIVIASNAPSGAVGIGGPPGEAVFLKAGASPIGPEVYLDTASNHYLINVDKGGGNSGSGEAASVTGHIANGLPAEEVDLQDPPYVSLERHHAHSYPITTGPEGELWLLVGTDSGFEGLTGLYYQRIAVTLEPVS